MVEKVDTFLAQEIPTLPIDFVVNLVNFLSFLSELDEWEFVDKLAKAIYMHTSASGVRVMTPNFVKILGTTIGVLYNFSSEHVRINVYFSDTNDKDVPVLNLISNIAETHYKNILKYQEMAEMALYDSLTGAYSKAAGLKLLESAVESVKRTGRDAFIIFIDIDNLKKINDEYGHLIGDEVLKSFAQACIKNMRKTDILIRFGGDEFILFVDSGNPEMFLERIKNLSAISFSYAIVPIENDRSLYEILKLADERMYKEKKKKKDLHMLVNNTLMPIQTNS